MDETLHCLSVTLHSTSNKTENKRYLPIGVRNDMLVCIDLCTLMVEELGFIGHRSWGKPILYKGSSLPIGGIKQ